MSTTVIHLCGQSLCTSDAAWSFIFPGRSRAMICEEHLQKLKSIAEALGLPLDSLDLQPVAREVGP